MENTQPTDGNLAVELNNCNVKTFDTTEMAIISAIRNGDNTILSICETTSLKEPFVMTIVKSLVNTGVLIDVPGADGSTYVIKVQNESGKKYKLGGNLLLPVSSFIDKEGNRWVTRGSWHKIDHDTDILNDIEWYDDTNEETQMKSIMKQVNERNRKNIGQKNVNEVSKGIGEPQIEMVPLVGTWVKLTDFVELNIIVAGATQSLCSVSFIFNNDSGYTFPWHNNTPVLMDNTFILDSVANKTFNKDITLDELVDNIKQKLCIMKSVDGDIFTYGEIKVKKGVYTITTKTHDSVAKKETVIDTVTVDNAVSTKLHIERDFKYTFDMIATHNSSL